MTLLENWAQLVACHEHPINKIVVHEPGAMARGIYRFSAYAGPCVAELWSA